MRSPPRFLSRAAFLLALSGCGAARSGGGFVESAATVCPPGTTVEGVDVTHFNGTVNWAAVRAAGIDFAFIKATDGTTLVDSKFSTNWNGSGQNGIIRGAYHFFQPTLGAVAQADFFVQTAGAPQ